MTVFKRSAIARHLRGVRKGGIDEIQGTFFFRGVKLFAMIPQGGYVNVTAVLFIAVLNWKQPGSPTAGECTNRGYSHAMEYYSARKGNELLLRHEEAQKHHTKQEKPEPHTL